MAFVGAAHVVGGELGGQHLAVGLAAHVVPRLGDLDHETARVLDRTDVQAPATTTIARLLSFDQKRTELTPAPFWSVSGIVNRSE